MKSDVLDFANVVLSRAESDLSRTKSVGDSLAKRAEYEERHAHSLTKLSSHFEDQSTYGFIGAREASELATPHRSSIDPSDLPPPRDPGESTLSASGPLRDPGPDYCSGASLLRGEALLGARNAESLAKRAELCSKLLRAACKNFQQSLDSSKETSRKAARAVEKARSDAADLLAARAKAAAALGKCERVAAEARRAADRAAAADDNKKSGKKLEGKAVAAEEHAERARADLGNAEEAYGAGVGRVHSARRALERELASLDMDAAALESVRIACVAAALRTHGTSFSLVPADEPRGPGGTAAPAQFPGRGSSIVKGCIPVVDEASYPASGGVLEAELVLRAAREISAVAAAVPRQVGLLASIPSGSHPKPEAPYQAQKLDQPVKVRGKRAKKRGNIDVERRTLNVQLKRVFEVGVEEVLVQERAAMGDPEDAGHPPLVPRIVTILADEVIANGGRDAEGIFRLSAEADKVRKLRAVLDGGGYSRLSTLCAGDPYLPAAVLKLWLRSLRTPLVAGRHYDEAMDAHQDPVRARAVVEALDPAPRAVVLYLAEYLADLAEHSAKTRMTAEQLAKLFVESIVPCADPTRIVADSPKGTEFIKSLMVSVRSSGTAVEQEQQQQDNKTD